MAGNQPPKLTTNAFRDFTTSIEEVMQSLNHLVQAGKVLYLGISDTPAWVVSKANQYARDHGLRQFSVYQGRWSAADRDFERDIIPMCRDEGMALAPWGALGGGHFKDGRAAQERRGPQIWTPERPPDPDFQGPVTHCEAERFNHDVRCACVRNAQGAVRVPNRGGRVSIPFSAVACCVRCSADGLITRNPTISMATSRR